MARLEIDLEIHAPGLDLHHERWNYHVMFMDEIHRHFRQIGARGWRLFNESGRGAILVDRDAWMKIIRGEWHQDEEPFPCRYIAEGETLEGVRLETLRSGFVEMVREYDPEQQVVMVVQHHSADLLSCYLFRFHGAKTRVIAAEAPER